MLSPIRSTALAAAAVMLLAATTVYSTEELVKAAKAVN